MLINLLQENIDTLPSTAEHKALDIGFYQRAAAFAEGMTGVAAELRQEFSAYAYIQFKETGEICLNNLWLNFLRTEHEGVDSTLTLVYSAGDAKAA